MHLFGCGDGMSDDGLIPLLGSAWRPSIEFFSSMHLVSARELYSGAG
jgi:hypothetical protein